MKKLAVLAILLGLVAFAGIIVISSKSENLPESAKTIGFIAIGYFGVIVFAWGWMKLFNKK
jgi:hypothetical protein